MDILFYTLSLLCAALIGHIIIWKIRLPKGHTSALFILFLTVLAAGVFYYISTAPADSALIPGVCRIVFLYISLMLSYITTYSALEVDSPSLVMVMIVARQGKSGLDKDSLYHVLGDNILIIPRVNDLLKGGFAYEKHGRIKITLKARLILWPILAYRKLVGAGKGG
jgi:hypothetical protein